MTKKNESRVSRRGFMAGMAAGGVASAESARMNKGTAQRVRENSPSATTDSYPKSFRGRHLRNIAFPLGGIGTGTVSLGGRGQLEDWEIFNRPDKGNSPDFCFFAIRTTNARRETDARILEARIQPPYEIAGRYRGLGFVNLPGLPRFDSAVFEGDYPFARINFEDDDFPLVIALEAFNPMVPLDTSASSLPVAIFRYTVHNPGPKPGDASISFSLQNPVGKTGHHCGYHQEGTLQGVSFSNPFLDANDPLSGSFVVSTLGAKESEVSHLTSWHGPFSRDWALRFWDDFKDDGALTNQPGSGRSRIGSLCVKKPIPGGETVTYTFLLSWHFPNRTPARCSWRAPKGHENDLIGNHYCSRFENAWAAAKYTAENLESLEKRTREFSRIVNSSTLPAEVKDAAMSNISTLRTNTCFQTSDGNFYGFEGCREDGGCCFGNCTHVWNYEQATGFLYPSLAKSMRESEFGPALDDEGRMSFRQLLPAGLERTGSTACDGQMGSVMKVYREWQLSGDNAWLTKIWPRVKKALEFAWLPNGWDSDRDGVMEGVQHNTYDIEFYGPNPQCGVWYLGALRAAEEMAVALGENENANRYRRLFENGSKWIDENLFNGEYYIQEIRPRTKEDIAEGLLLGLGSTRHRPEDPFHQVGDGCLVDQLVGQYFAHLTGLGYLLDRDRVRRALTSLYRYNFRTTMEKHESVHRTFALNDESALLICTYPDGKRPELPFWFFMEVMTGFEYQAAVHMIYEGMLEEGLNIVRAIRQRYDGEKRSPWNEAECGHHYARAMASWGLIPAYSGFQYSAPTGALGFAPRLAAEDFNTFWSCGTAWGRFSQKSGVQSLSTKVEIVEGSFKLKSLALKSSLEDRANLRVDLDQSPLKFTTAGIENELIVEFEKMLTISAGQTLSVMA